MSADRVQGDVTQQLGEVAVVQHQSRLEASLEHVSEFAAPRVPGPREIPEEISAAVTECGSGVSTTRCTWLPIRQYVNSTHRYRTATSAYRRRNRTRSSSSSKIRSR